MRYHFLHSHKLYKITGTSVVGGNVQLKLVEPLLTDTPLLRILALVPAFKLYLFPLSKLSSSNTDYRGYIEFRLWWNLHSYPIF